MSDPEITSSPLPFFDLQVNGYGGVDFNADVLCPDEVAAACRRLKADGVGGILATVITDDVDSMCRRLSNICRARDADDETREMICGVHIEGPFINAETGYVGAHPAAEVRPADPETMKRLLDAAEGLTRIVTLAPECDADAATTRMLAEKNVVVSAGHCDSDLETLKRSIDSGLSMVTHLGNGCPLTIPRHDNIIQRVLSLSEHLHIGFIADGVHVPYESLGNYLAIAGFEKSFIVTDSISAAGRGPGEFQLGNRRVVVDQQLATWSEDRQNLVGSASTMPAVVEKLSKQLKLSAEQIDRLTRINPRNAIGEKLA